MSEFHNCLFSFFKAEWAEIESLVSLPCEATSLSKCTRSIAFGNHFLLANVVIRIAYLR